MPDWATFAAFAFVTTSALLLLSHASRGVFSDDDSHDESHLAEAVSRDETSETTTHDQPQRRAGDGGHQTTAFGATLGDPPDSEHFENAAEAFADAGEPRGDDPRTDERADDDALVATPRLRYGPQRPADDTEASDELEFSTAALLVNVAFSQGLFAVLIVVGAWYTEIPAWAFGVGIDTLTLRNVALGVALGVTLYGANELGAAAGEQFGLGGGEELRRALAPDSKLGWAVLLVVVLPVIAGFEELLFRGALVGVFAAGFDISPWVMAVVASAAFALGHGAQGRLGVLVTGVLGFVLAAAFVVTESLLVVVVAHYLVNALEFVVHEGLGWEWARGH
jgi:membrane protease YdiL (CAAX protease family)